MSTDTDGQEREKAREHGKAPHRAYATAQKQPCIEFCIETGGKDVRVDDPIDPSPMHHFTSQW
ncbi:hypothetical protein AE1304_33240 [Aeromonas enteropelogenes]